MRPALCHDFERLRCTCGGDDGVGGGDGGYDVFHHSCEGARQSGGKKQDTCVNVD